MVGDAQANPRMGAVERAEHGQKKAVQRGFARADGDHAALQAAVAGQLFLARLNLFTGDGNARKQLFALRREHRAAVAAHKERTAERRFQIADGSGKVGLAGQQRPGGFGEAAEPGDGVENAIGIVADEHGVAPSVGETNSFRHGFAVPTFGVFHRQIPPLAVTLENVPRRGRSFFGDGSFCFG